jgi:small-conductance mechanosensitive channel
LALRLLRGRRPYIRSILEATKNPTRVGLLLLGVAVALPTAPLDAETTSILAKCLGLATICLLGWIALTAVNIATNLYLMRFRLDVADNLLARKHITQIRILVRALDTVIVLVTLGFALMTFEAVRQYGVSLFASAGVVGVVFGLAAQPVLSNLIAGVQIAVTQPIRLEDAVTVQNEYGWIEEINATYVVIRLWDLRRLIVPLNYFIQQPFYNWTRQNAATLGSVMLYLDYSAPVDIVRKKAIELVEQSERGKAAVTSVQVTNTTAQGIQVQILVHSEATAITNNVCADLREQLIAYLNKEHPEALPRSRSETFDPARQNTEEPRPSAMRSIG